MTPRLRLLLSAREDAYTPISTLLDYAWPASRTVLNDVGERGWLDVGRHAVRLSWFGEAVRDARLESARPDVLTPLSLMRGLLNPQIASTSFGTYDRAGRRSRPALHIGDLQDVAAVRRFGAWWLAQLDLSDEPHWRPATYLASAARVTDEDATAVLEWLARSLLVDFDRSHEVAAITARGRAFLQLEGV